VSCEKYTTVVGVVVWSCWSKLNYYPSFAFGPSRHDDII